MVFSIKSKKKIIRSVIKKMNISSFLRIQASRVMLFLVKRYPNMKILLINKRSQASHVKKYLKKNKDKLLRRIVALISSKTPRKIQIIEKK